MPHSTESTGWDFRWSTPKRFPRLRWHASPERILVLFAAAVVLTSAETVEEARTKILAAYGSSLDALHPGDPDGAMQIDTDDWVSLNGGQEPRSKRDLEP